MYQLSTVSDYESDAQDDKTNLISYGFYTSTQKK